jgi:hypothetical protein
MMVKNKVRWFWCIVHAGDDDVGDNDERDMMMMIL